MPQTSNPPSKKSIPVQSEGYSSKKVYIKSFERQWRHTKSRSPSSTSKKAREEETKNKSIKSRRSKDWKLTPLN